MINKSGRVIISKENIDITEFESTKLAAWLRKEAIDWAILRLEKAKASVDKLVKEAP